MHSVGFALFHVAFRKLFDWPRSLRSTTLANRAIVQILNLRLIWVLLCVTAAFGAAAGRDHRQQARTRAVGGDGALFWVGRTIEQFIFLRINDRRVHVLTALFLLGAVLFGWAWFAAQGQA